MDFKNISPKFNFEKSTDSDDFVASITHQLFTQIVKEEDEYTMNIIEEYVKNKQHEGECIAAKIIPEGKLRHIINLGLTRYAAQEHIDLKPGDMFPQEQYIEFLRRELQLANEKINKLQERNKYLAKLSGLISEETNIGGTINDCKTTKR